MVKKLVDGKYQISGEVGNGEAVLFQQTYDPGWKVRNRGWKVIKDPLDFMVLVPKKASKFEIELVYGRPLSVWLGYLITLGTVAWVFNKTYKSYKSYRFNRSNS